MRGHIIDQHRHHELRNNNTLYVIGVCSNPARWHSRYHVAREWIKHMLGTHNVHLTIVEGQYGERHHELEPHQIDPDQHIENFRHRYDHLKLNLRSEAWVKESMINIGFRHAIAVHGAKYLCWCDMDIFFRDEHWAQEALHQLQTYPVIQPWQDCADLGPQGGISRHFRSFGYQHQRGIPKQTHPSQTYYEYAHTGFAWCCTREFWEQCMGLMDFPILGSADHHMGFAMIGRVNDTIHRGMTPAFFELCREWQERAMQITNGEVGFSVGRIEHWFHGPKNRRYYRERWQILVDNKFDPKIDLRRSGQGIQYLVGKPKLEHAIIKYNRSRLEDSIEEF